MALQRICDIDGKTDAKQVIIEIDGAKYSKDLCPVHQREIVKGAEVIQRRRGRPRKGASKAAAKRRGRPRKKTVGRPRKKTGTKKS